MRRLLIVPQPEGTEPTKLPSLVTPTSSNAPRLKSRASSIDSTIRLHPVVESKLLSSVAAVEGNSRRRPRSVYNFEAKCDSTIEMAAEPPQRRSNSAKFGI